MQVAHWSAQHSPVVGRAVQEGLTPQHCVRPQPVLGDLQPVLDHGQAAVQEAAAAVLGLRGAGGRAGGSVGGQRSGARGRKKCRRLSDSPTVGEKRLRRPTHNVLIPRRGQVADPILLPPAEALRQRLQRQLLDRLVVEEALLCRPLLGPAALAARQGACATQQRPTFCMQQGWLKRTSLPSRPPLPAQVRVIRFLLWILTLQ